MVTKVSMTIGVLQKGLPHEGLIVKLQHLDGVLNKGLSIQGLVDINKLYKSRIACMVSKVFHTRWVLQKGFPHEGLLHLSKVSAAEVMLAWVCNRGRGLEGLAEAHSCLAPQHDRMLMCL